MPSSVNGYSGLVLVDRPVSGVLVATLNRPDKLNALSKGLLQEFAGILEEAADDESVRCVILTGAGKAFSAGADIADMVERGLDSYLDPERLGAWQVVEKFTKPLIAAVNGYALGGGFELAMLCDIMIASEAAHFALPEVNIGVLPGDGGTQRLPRIVGKGFAMRMICTGAMIDAFEAERRGVAMEVAKPEALMTKAIELARTIAEKPPISVRRAKQAIRRAFDTPLEEGLAFERDMVTQAFATEDRAEGMRAFLEKRPAKFVGR